MTKNEAALYSAFAARDSRFDGVFYVGVTSTGIYCRPVCTARTPKAENCRFFTSAAAAERESFRPCLRCRPELAPGNAPVDDSQRIANLIAQRIEEGTLDGGEGIESLAAKFGWSSRQIRRMLEREYGVSPMELLMTRRLLLAKQLLTDTDLPVSRVALASGFSSVRRFNDAFVRRYGMAPTRLRKVSNDGAGPDMSDGRLTLQLGYRPPFAWEHLLRFVRFRAMAGVEWTDGEEYARTVRLGTHTGWIRVRNVLAARVLRVEVSDGLTPALPALLGRLRHLFDLSARPDVIDEHLSRSEIFTGLGGTIPGLRVPGTFDGFELAARAILGQQVSVKAATTLASRFAAAFGDPISVPHEGLSRLGPTAERLSRASVSDLTALGMTRARAASIIALATEIAAGRLRLEPGAEPDETIRRLVALPGIGPWTANYIAMRALRWPDAFLRDDAVVSERLGGVRGARAEKISKEWSPWRAYAVIRLWEGAMYNSPVTLTPACFVMSA